MNEPRYTYTAEAPCFSITHDQPFVLKGCSCGWPITSCLKQNASNLADREKAYETTIHMASRTTAAVSHSSQEKP